MRLDRYVSHATAVPRKQTLDWIASGRVHINDHRATEPRIVVVSSHDEVSLDGSVLRRPPHRTLVMNKPKGCISATRSEQHRTVIDHVPADLLHPKLSPAGRLDKDTTGLLLLSTDKGLIQYLTHPKHKVEKTYVVRLKTALAGDAEQRVAAGMVLSDGTHCKPALLERIEEHEVHMTLREGRFHQVKRMIGHLGGHLIDLHRRRIGRLSLDEALETGQCRPLTTAEWRDVLDSLPETRTTFP